MLSRSLPLSKITTALFQRHVYLRAGEFGPVENLFERRAPLLHKILDVRHGALVVYLGRGFCCVEVLDGRDPLVDRAFVFRGVLD